MQTAAAFLVLLLPLLPCSIKYLEVTAQEEITVRLHWNQIPWRYSGMTLEHAGEKYVLLNPDGVACDHWWSPKGDYVCQVMLVHWKREATIMSAEVEEPVGRCWDWRR